MKKILFSAAAALVCVSASAQYYYQDANNGDVLCHSKETAPVRAEIILPQVNGYNVYKADLHVHTMYSDGDVTPEYRAHEAWNDGLDVIALTDHLEVRAHEGKMIKYMKGYVKDGAKAINTDLRWKAADERGIQIDLNHSAKMCRAAARNYGIVVIPGIEITRDFATVGHYNALFTTDNNAIYDPDPAQSIRNARAQGAVIMHNHPGGGRTDMNMHEFETRIYEEGLVDGIETMNARQFYPSAIGRAHKYGFFMAANTDEHKPTYERYRLNGSLRNMTLILAKDDSLESLKEALLAHRTLAYSFGTLAGEEQLLKDFFEASVSARILKDGKSGDMIIALTNTTSLPYLIKFESGNPISLPPFSSIKKTGGKGKKLTFTVMNMWCSSEAHPQITVDLKYNNNTKLK
jgi:predicted metal-dependent phosphoesterase TrpH